MEPIIDLIWSVEEENEPDDLMQPMSANCGGNGCCSGTSCISLYNWLCLG